MASSKNSVLKILGYLYIPIAIICLLLNMWLIYYEVYLKDNVIAIHTNFIDETEYSKDQKFFMEVNIYDNVIEWKWNYYIDTNIPEKNEDGSYDEKYMFSTGVQFYAEPIAKRIQYSEGLIFQDKSYHGYELQNCVYYSQPDGLDSAYVSGGNNLANQDAWLWDIGGELCCIKIKGPVFTEQRWWCPNYEIYDVAKLIAENTDSVKSIKEGVTITTFDFSNYFNLFMLNEESGKFDKPIVDDNILKEWTFITVKVTKHNADMISAKQSIFGSYKGDSEWNADESVSNLPYWLDETVKNLTLQDCRYESYGDGLGLALKNSCIKYLSEFEGMYITLTIDLDEIDDTLNVIGFTDNPFGDLKVDKVVIMSDTEREFRVPAGITVETENVVITGGGSSV